MRACSRDEYSQRFGGLDGTQPSAQADHWDLHLQVLAPPDRDLHRPGGFCSQITAGSNLSLKVLRSLGWKCHGAAILIETATQ